MDAHNYGAGAGLSGNAADLATQLLRYKKYKEAAKVLKKMDLMRHQSWTRDVEIFDRVTFLPDPDVTLESLTASLRLLASELKDIIKLPE